MNLFFKKGKVFLCFFLGIIVYGIIVSLFTSTVHIKVDEELYLALAKSFHYKGVFEIEGNIVNYNCYLYSALISFAYFFYSPEKILFLMRLIGVVSMCSAIFPIYFLAKSVLKSEGKALAISGFTMILPYMFDSAYLMQEVLSYPLFMWAIYFVYCFYEKENVSKAYISMVMGAVLSVLCLFSKTYMFFIPIVVNIYVFISLLKRKASKREVIGIILYDVCYLFSVLVMYMGLRLVNGGIEGVNHYADQFSNLFPITGWTLISGIAGCMIYGALFIINLGIVPPCSLFIGRNRYEKGSKWLADFCLLASAFLVIEIVFLVVLTEEGVPTVPHKFLFRYFQVLVPPVLILFLKADAEELFRQKKLIYFWIAGSAMISFLYFLGMNGNTRQAIADGHFYLLLENITKYFMPYADAVFVLLFAFIIFVFVRMSNNRKVINNMLKLGVIGIGLFWILNCIQLPVYTNVIADGRTIQSDSIKIARYLNDEGYNFLYYVAPTKKDENSYERNFYGYIRQTYRTINLQQMNEIIEQNENAVFIIPAEYEAEDYGLNRIELGTQKLMILISENKV